jgi:hypothetical protein
LSCQKPGVRVCRAVEHPCRDFKPPICLRPFQRAAEDDITSFVDCLMNANSATKPRMMPIKNLAKNGPVGVLKPRCTTTSERIGHWIRIRRSIAKFSESEASNHTPSLAPFTTTTPEFKFSVYTGSLRMIGRIDDGLLFPAIVRRPCNITTVVFGTSNSMASHGV